MKYLGTVGDALSQLLGALLHLTQNANESISGASYRLRNDGRMWAYKLINWLFRVLFKQEDHCKMAYDNDILRAIKVLRQAGFIVTDPSDLPDTFSDEPDPVGEWAWNEDDYLDFIQGPAGFERKKKFHMGIKEYGFTPQNVKMGKSEYDYWARRALDDSTEWIAENATPAPRKNHGM